MTDDLLTQAKRELRKRVRAARADCGDGHSDQMIAYVKEHQLHTVAAYVNFGVEPSTAKFLNWANARGVRVLLPRIIDDSQLDWHLYNAGHLQTGSMGIEEPSGESVALSAAQVVFTPALAAGRDGSRLGRGRGFYDRALQTFNAPILALVHSNEIFDTVPHETHDVKVTGVMTCSETLRLN